MLPGYECMRDDPLAATRCFNMMLAFVPSMCSLLLNYPGGNVAVSCVAQLRAAAAVAPAPRGGSGGGGHSGARDGTAQRLQAAAADGRRAARADAAAAHRRDAHRRQAAPRRSSLQTGNRTLSSVKVYMSMWRMFVGCRATTPVEVALYLRVSHQRTMNVMSFNVQLLEPPLCCGCSTSRRTRRRWRRSRRRCRPTSAPTSRRRSSSARTSSCSASTAWTRRSRSSTRRSSRSRRSGSVTRSRPRWSMLALARLHTHSFVHARSRSSTFALASHTRPRSPLFALASPRSPVFALARPCSPSRFPFALQAFVLASGCFLSLFIVLAVTFPPPTVGFVLVIALKGYSAALNYVKRTAVQ